MDKQTLKFAIAQLRRGALCAVCVSLLTACGGGQSGMKLGDDEFAVMQFYQHQVTKRLLIRQQ